METRNDKKNLIYYSKMQNALSAPNPQRGLQQYNLFCKYNYYLKFEFAI